MKFFGTLLKIPVFKKLQEVSFLRFIGDMKRHFTDINKIILLIIIVLNIFLIFSCKEKVSVPSNNHQIIQGVLELPESLQYDTSGIILEGEWEFYPGEFIAPGSARNTVSYFQVPGFWNQKNVEGRELSPFGFASYRLNIAGLKGGIYGIHIVDLESAYSLYINGKKIGENGIPGKSERESVPEWKPETYLFSVKSGDSLEIILHVSNFHHRLGGIWIAPEIGAADLMIGKKISRLMLEIFFVGAIFIAAFYHFQIYLFRKKEYPFLFFSIAWFFLGLRILVTGERLLVHFTGIPWSYLVSMDYLTALSSYLGFHLFLYTSNPRNYSKFVIKAILIISTVLIIPVVITAPVIFSNILPYTQLFFVSFGFYWIYSSFRSFRDHEKGFGSIFVGGCVMFVTGVNDILYNASLVNSENILQYGSFFFLLTQAYYLSIRYNEAFHRSETLSQNIAAQLNFTRDLSNSISIENAVSTTLAEINNKFIDKETNEICFYLSEINDKNWKKYVIDSDNNLVCDAVSIDESQNFNISKSYGRFNGCDYFPVVYKDRVLGVFSISGMNAKLDSDTNNLITGMVQSLGPVLNNLKTHEKSKLEAIGLLATEIVHDIRNHLQIIFLSIEKKAKKMFSESDVSETFDVIRMEAKSLAQMSQDILDYTNEKILLQKENTNIRQYLEKIYEEIKYFADSNSIRSVIDIVSDANVLIDRERMRRAIINLVKNGVEAMKAGGSLEIISDVENDEVCIIIKDSGPGIKKDQMNKLFMPFSVTNKSSGTGLGLSVVKKIVDAHEGDISVLSGENGTRFTIKLPLHNSLHNSN